MQTTKQVIFYRVFQNDTVVTKLSFHNFKKHFNIPEHQHTLGGVFNIKRAHHYTLADGSGMYYGYKHEWHAMEMAKAGSLKYMNDLIAEGPESNEKLYQYRLKHYDDLNIHLLDSNIQRIKNLTTTEKL
jgi:hypothetical protein